MRKLPTLALLLGVFAVNASSQQTTPTNESHTIQVSGSAVVNISADMALINFGVETSNADISAARDSNQVILKRALAAIVECGVNEKDTHTDFMSILPQWSYTNGKRLFVGYAARNTLVVSLNNLGRFDLLISKVLQTGVTNVNSVEYQTSDIKKQRELARGLAIKAAIEKARQMAAALGCKVGDPVSVSETSPYIPRRLPSSSGSYGAVGLATNTIIDAQPEQAEYSSGVPVGQISVREAVIVTFELKK